MKVPLKWLKEYIDLTLPPAELAEKLTMAGIEAGGIEVIGERWDNVVVGEIVAVKPHPNADRLRLPTVDLGTEQQTVVCGAPNLRVGDKVAFARVGAELIDGHTGQLTRLKPAKIRGVESSGMVCSEKELGISDNHQEILVLPPDAPVGAPLAEYLGDVILDLEVTPNRADCLSIIGIAREVAALTGQSLHPPKVSYEESPPPIAEQVAIEIADPDLCPRYCASLITGVKIAESPQWMQRRLLACGMRPINNIVDITNYVMLELGQPLHAFDYEKIMGRKIIVRRAEEGEIIVSLDGVERTLSHDMLVIADEVRAVAIAGVMGGANSEVTEETTSILLEAASFNPASIHHTSRSLSLPSEASMRFERGIRPELTIPALKRATQLMAELAGGKVAQGVADVYPGRRKPKPIRLSAEKTKALLGVEFSLEQIVSTLTSLGFECQPASADEIQVTPPYWRGDIQQAVDLIEEVARIAGYDKIPTTMLSQPLPRQNPAPIIGLRQKIRNSLIGYGFQEVITYSLTSLEMLRKLRPEAQPLEPTPLRLANPMTADQEYLRPTLRANLLAILEANRRHEEDGIRLFELGKVYLVREGDLPDEPEVLCGLLSGTREEKSWHGDGSLLDFFDAKGVVEGLLAKLGVAASFEPSDDASFHPLKQAAIVIGDRRLGVVGELHPKVAAAFDISEPAYLFEIRVTDLLPFTLEHKMFQPIPRFPPTVRDIALIVDNGVSHQQVVDIIKGFSLVKQVTIFDVYSGKQVPEGKKSLAYRITYQSPTHTLTDEEVNKVQEQILRKLSQQLGATLRG
ncbi:MAG TPA: phenylalanine--tRNA ligase subunit beta [Dehalococcoidia bacterium]|jgi:phenylalanyl-tRNA synthetase beta chain|nr:phenylalanine--tRNA ligase subunit beta [Dehalococcoidia bacterium]